MVPPPQGAPTGFLGITDPWHNVCAPCTPMLANPRLHLLTICDLSTREVWGRWGKKEKFSLRQAGTDSAQQREEGSG